MFTEWLLINVMEPAPIYIVYKGYDYKKQLFLKSQEIKSFELMKFALQC